MAIAQDVFTITSPENNPMGDEWKWLLKEGVVYFLKS